ncbi:squamosa promoter-binding-like protein 12 isoform X2 [Humulus lupulus]|uniref:squamosa promoter-binding-like protein 12 isoform X2 n=1 Tax=Humulus lupulus TaxID=3486 RepID=UPI002B404995|nr:squamosa promoter-binding-like protein 12 isoform X2 [Humulus lupulus]
MEAKFGGKRSLEWDLNDWRWDGDLFNATPSLNSLPSAHLSKTWPSFSEDSHNHNHKRALLVNEEESNQEATAAAASLNLKLGIAESEGKKLKTAGTTSCGIICQVEDCTADLTNAKDYHRRHKVCDIHSKATEALISNTMQRFCQQCSRFHLLQEFDQGKRSCRRRLAGHNRRRRKTHPDNTLHDEKNTNYLLLSLLRILSNMHSNSSDQPRDQDLLSCLLKNLTNIASSVDGRRNMSAVLQDSQGLINAGTSVEASLKPMEMISDTLFGSASKVGDNPISLVAPSKCVRECNEVSVSDMALKKVCAVDANGGSMQTLSGLGSINPLCSIDNLSAKSIKLNMAVGPIKPNNIDLNIVYDDSHLPVNSETDSLDNPLCIQHDNLHKPSSSHPSQNSDSTSTRSPSSSSGEIQSRTDRIVFKLFGKEPEDLPFLLRTQILNWLSLCPTDIESYIRPGCVILTIYLHLEKITWEELHCDLGSSLKRLLAASNDPFWRTGWVYSRVQNSVAFMHNGQLVLDTPLPQKSYKNCRISSIKPVAVALSERAQFEVKGFNLFHPSMRLLCALDGKYLVQEICNGLMDNTTGTAIEHDEIQCLRFSCSIPTVTGRGFIEVEDYGFSSSFFPFIVAEQEVCSEICMLQGAIEVEKTVGDADKARNQALDFVHEMGWLLHRSQAKLRLGPMDPNSDLFPFKRFKWLMEFSMDHDWCFVVKKLLCILFEGIVDAGEHSSIEVAILNMSLLHRAVQRNSRPMVDNLLKFVIPQKIMNKPQVLFKADHVGAMGSTPLHVAANQGGCDGVLDALTDDPGKVGIEVWKNARDETGLTPNDYACLRGHYSYIHLVQRKMSQVPSSESGHVAVDILDDDSSSSTNTNNQQKQRWKGGNMEIDKNEMKEYCRRWHWHRQRQQKRSSLVYKPAMICLVGIAAVCVCVALLFKSSPEVLYVFKPFRWERLKYGSC